MELMRAPCDLPAYLPEPAYDMPGYHARDRLADDFECFLGEQFNACTPQQTATRFSEPSTDAMEQSTLAKPCGRAQPTKSREQRRKTHNRAAQKQWREKQKTRAEELEAQVEAATAQLKALEDTQRQLEARNALLEVANPSICDEQTQHIYSLGGVDLTDLMRADTQQTLTITILDGPPQVKTRDDVDNMTFHEFASLTAAYARKLGDCLMEVTRAGAGAYNPALRQLRTWTSECSSLRVFMVLGSPKKFEAYIAKRLDGQPGLDASELDDSWYRSMLAAMQYTEEQQQDLMLLRRLFYGKLGVLARERKECLRRVPLGAAMTDHEVNSRLAEVVATAQELRDITAAEFQTKLQFTSAYRRGIPTLVQQAMSMVKPFPYIAEKPRIFELLAMDRGEPSAEQLMQSAGLDNIQHNARWQHIVKYLATVVDNNLDLHVPIIRRL